MAPLTSDETAKTVILSCLLNLLTISKIIFVFTGSKPAVGSSNSKNLG